MAKSRIPSFDKYISESNEYCDFGCGYIGTFIKNNPSFDNEKFYDYVSCHNKADRDSGELQDICKEEILRLAREFSSEKIIESESSNVTLNVTISNIDESTAKDFIQMFKFMQWCGSVGTARSMNAFFDGDGHFRPKIDIEGIDLKTVELKFDSDKEDTLKLGFGA